MINNENTPEIGAEPPFRFCDVRAMCETAPVDEYDFVLPGFLAGTVGGIAAPGGTGKSTMLLESAASIASGTDLLGLGIEGCGRVVIMAAEDPECVLHKRLHVVARRLGREARERLFERLTIVNCVGVHSDIMRPSWMKTLASVADGARLVVLDTLSRFHGLDENKNEHARRIMRELERFSDQTGSSVLYSHHVAKAAALAGMADLQQAARGSSIFVDDARYLAFIALMTVDEAKERQIPESDRTKYVRFNASKLNYGARGADKWFIRGEAGVLSPVNISAPVAAKSRSAAAAGLGRRERRAV